MKILYKIERYIYKIELSFIVLLLLSLSVFAFCQVILRNIFSYSIIWMAVFNNMALLILAMLGASLATCSFERRHINIDLFQGILKPPYNKYLSVGINFAAGAACLMFFFFAAHYVVVSKSVGKMEGPIYTPEWVIALIFPVCLLSMSYKFFLSLLTDVIELRKQQKQ